MTDAQELLDEWTSGEQSGMRPKRLQAVRDDMMDATGEVIPRRIPEIQSLILNSPQKRGVITRKLREAVDATEADEDTESGETAEGSDGSDSDSTQ